MIARTIGEMISLLEEFPLDCYLKDSDRDGYSITKVIPHVENPELPVLVLRKCLYYPDGGKVVDFLSTLIDISIDPRFSGKDSVVFHANDRSEGSTFAKFGLLRAKGRPSIMSYWNEQGYW